MVLRSRALRARKELRYNPALPNLAHIIHKHSNVLYSSDCCRNVFKNLPLVGYLRCKHISDILLEPSLRTAPTPVTHDTSPVPFGATTGIAPPVPILNMAVINTLFILQVRLTTSNLISLVKLLMLSIWFNVACVIYNILEKLNVTLKTVLMNTDDLLSTLLIITSILQFHNTFLPVIIPTIICFWFLLKNLMGVILSGKHVKPTLSIKLRQLSLWVSINVMNCNYL